MKRAQRALRGAHSPSLADPAAANAPQASGLTRARPQRPVCGCTAAAYGAAFGLASPHPALSSRLLSRAASPSGAAALPSGVPRAQSAMRLAVRRRSAAENARARARAVVHCATRGHRRGAAHWSVPAGGTRTTAALLCTAARPTQRSRLRCSACPAHRANSEPATAHANTALVASLQRHKPVSAVPHALEGCSRLQTAAAARRAVHQQQRSQAESPARQFPGHRIWRRWHQGAHVRHRLRLSGERWRRTGSGWC